MNKWLKKGISVTLAGVMVLGLAACGSKGGGGSSDGHLVFQIWDQGQKAGMEAMADAYMKEHEDVSIEVQAVGWDEYWTKLEASATSNSMPDIFWMHSNQIYKYADNGILADCSEIVNTSDYSEASVANATGSNGIFGAGRVG